MKIEKLSQSPDRAGRYTVKFDDGTQMRLYRQTIQDFCLYTGMELDESQFAALEKAAGEMSAKMRAVRIVSASSVSKGDLQQRLIRKGEDPEQAKAAVSWMSELDLIDDRKTAQQIVQRCISKGYGLARAKQALYEKRIPKHYWDEALQDYPDQLDEIREYLRTHLDRKDPKQVKRVIDALLRRGHSYGTIRRAMGEFSLDSEEFPEE